jgi:septum formation protein
MYRNTESIILASGSPRRRQYLEDMGLVFQVQTADVDERPHADEDPADFVVRMAREKAAAVRAAFPESWVISGDTVVCLGRRILGKPVDADHAVAQLLALAGVDHRVMTGFCIAHAGRRVEIARSVTTTVRFTAFSEATARAYVAAGESLDKAGAYAIQGKGACLVEAIDGSYSNVVGLPLCEVLHVLETNGVIEPFAASERHGG